jgi:predicted nucleic acid-binding protein
MKSQKSTYKQTALDLREIAGENLKMLEKSMDNFQREMEPEMISFLSDFAVNNFTTFFSKGIKVSLVIDTNSIINSIHNKFFKGQNTILIPISKNPLVSIYYSDYIKDETLRKIKEGVIKKKGRETPSLENIMDFAEELFSCFTHVSDSEILSHPFAVDLAERDPKDVPILNLSFSKNTDGILTGDKDFEEFDQKSWKISEFGDTVGALNKGILSFTFTTGISAVLIYIFKLIFSFLKELVLIVISFVNGLVRLIGRNPMLSLAAVIGGAIWHERVKNESGTSPLKKFAAVTSEKTKSTLKNISSFLKEFEKSEEVQAFKPIAAYAVSLTYDLLATIEDLDKLKMDDNDPA